MLSQAVWAKTDAEEKGDCVVGAIGGSIVKTVCTYEVGIKSKRLVPGKELLQHGKIVPTNSPIHNGRTIVVHFAVVGDTSPLKQIDRRSPLIADRTHKRYLAVYLPPQHMIGTQI